MPQSDPWTTFDRRILREGITIPPMLGPYLDQLRESGGEPPEAHIVGGVCGPYPGPLHAVLVIDCGDLGLTPSEVVDG